MDDRELLQKYTEGQSDEAFAELVSRHVNLVYSTAYRVVGEAQLAQDVAQSVFIKLAQKAGTVREGNALPGWLYRATCSTAANAIRSESRRRHRETEAMNRAELDAIPQDSWEAIAPLLEEGMRELNQTEQDAIVLRFFEGKTLREAGETLGLSENAVQKRVSQAVERLRDFFVKRGVTTSAAALSLVLSANAVQAAPVGLAVSISSAAAVGGTAVASATTAAAGKAVTMTAIQKAVITATLTATVGAGIYVVNQTSHEQTQAGGSFKPVVKRVLRASGGKMGFHGLDLESGVFQSCDTCNSAAFGGPVNRRVRGDVWEVFFRDLPVDFVAVNTGDTKWELVGRQFMLAPIPKERWDSASAAELRQAVEGAKMENRKGWRIQSFSSDAAMPLTFALQTDSGVVGVLQITGFTNIAVDVDRDIARAFGMQEIPTNSPAITLRYKLAERTKPPPLAFAIRVLDLNGILETNTAGRVFRINLTYDYNNQGERIDSPDKGDAYAEWLPAFPDLEELWLKETQATDRAMRAVGRLQQLQVLLMSDATRLTDEGVAQLKDLKQLHTLLITKSRITDRALPMLAALPKLQSLTLQENNLSEKGLRNIASLTQLTNLCLGNKTAITDRGVESLSGLVNLQQLELQNCDITDAGLRHLQGLKKLRRLIINGAETTEAGRARLQAAIPGLEITGFTNNPAGAKPRDNLVELTRPPSLTEAVNGIKALGGFVKTNAAGRIFRVSMVFDEEQGKRVECKDNSDQFAQWLPGFPDLEELWLQRGQATDRAMRFVGRLHGLKMLMMWDAERLTDEGVAQLADLKQLEFLHIGESGIGDGALATLAGLPKLQSVSLQENYITDRGLPSLAGMTQLTNLWIGNGVGITDRGLASLSGLTNLQQLELQHTSITDDGLRHLHGLKKLRQLFVSGTQTTEEGCAQLKAAIPDLKIRTGH